MAKPKLVPADQDRRMTVLEHLEELRRVLIVSLISWAAGTVIGFAISGIVLEILLRPVRSVIGGQHIVYFTGPVDKFFLYFKVGIFTGFILSSPIILWQVWTFVAPGLHRNERRFAVGFVASAVGLFIAGILFAFFAMPIALRFLTGFGSSDIQYFPLADRYINFVLIVIAIFGVTFELPLALTLLGLMGIVTPAFLRHRRIWFWIGIFIGANLFTPGVDPFTPLLLAVPLILLFEASILVISALRR
ncbi:MAG TPA: twin-arginine translocase subunit TatC [Candidatus Dormibacteraeota bacterium]|jgi:sec-independent protein translocase protein TatC|nr:twin-arginine translocase subunit TatC [Candidatus Dormibacteraeota bacterium]